MKKDNIPLPLKVEVWEKFANDPFRSITSCLTCLAPIGVPKCVADYLAIEIEYRDDVQLSGIAQFGHIIAESKGGPTKLDNLILQCAQCNQITGTSTIEEIDTDVLMLDVQVDIQMGENRELCIRCKNPATYNGTYCNRHLV